jgi:hypothetical protein
MFVAQLSYYHGGFKSFVNIDSFENQSKHACEQLSKLLKMDWIQKYILNVTSIKHGQMITLFFFKTNTKMNKYNIVFIVLRFDFCFQV